MQPINCRVLQDFGEKIFAAYTQDTSLSEITPPLLQEFLTHHTWDESIFLKDFVKSCTSQQLSPKGDFGEPPMTVYFSSEKEFCIDIYLWLKADTNIHDHGFEGAFAVLQGKSLQGTFHFEETEKLKQSAQKGILKPKKLEWLSPGDIRKIKSGPEFIHQIIHFGRPSYTMVIRTTGTKFKSNSTVQHNYDLRTMATMSHPQDYNWVKFRLLKQMFEKNLLTVTELESLDLFHHQIFLAWLSGQNKNCGLYPSECREIRSNQLKLELLTLLSHDACVLLLALDFYRNKKQVQEWIDLNLRFINQDQIFREISTKLLERNVLNETAEQALYLLWRMGRKETFQALDGDQSFFMRLNQELDQVTFLSFLNDEKTNP